MPTSPTVIIIIVSLSMMNAIGTVHVVKYSAEPSQFSDMHYHDLDLKFKDKYTFYDISEVWLTDDHCLTECNYQKFCRYGYFFNSVCYICNKSAEDYMLDWRTTLGADGQKKKAADGKLWRRNR